MDTNKVLYMETSKLFDLFVKTNRLSTNVDSLSTLNEALINDILKCTIEENNFKNQDSIDLLYYHIYTKIICKVLLVNVDEEGIYLVREDDKQKITIPGGHVSYEDYDKEKPLLSILESTACRELLEEYNSIDLYESQKYSNNLEVDFTLRSLGFNVLELMDAQYLYSDQLNTLTIFIPVRVSDILYGMALRHSEYVDKNEYINYKRRDVLEEVYYDGIDNDIRFNKFSFILDTIFNTKLV